jgi:hypothetical protein
MSLLGGFWKLLPIGHAAGCAPGGADRGRPEVPKYSTESQVVAVSATAARRRPSHHSVTADEYCPLSSTVARRFGIRHRRRIPPIVRPLRGVGGDDDDEVGQANEAPITTTERARSVAIGGDADSSRM